MQSMVHSFPVPPGKSAEIDQMLEHLGGAGHERLKELGVNAVRVWHQTEPLEAIVVYVEAEDLGATLAQRAKSEHSAEITLDRLFEELTGHPTHAMRGAPTRLVLDWHRERGHRSPPHPRHAHH